MSLSLKTIAIALAVMCGALNGFASDDALDLTFEQNIAAPQIPKRAKEYVKTHMDQLRRNLVKNGLEAKTIREGEALRITIACDELFAPGAVELKPSAMAKLRKMSVVARDPRRYKIVVAVHTDDTGDEQYADSISASRANAIDDGLWQIAGEIETNVIPYGIGKDIHVASNTSRANRAKNRRAEIYIIPDEGLLELAGVKLKK